MSRKKEDKFLKWLGIVLMVVGGIVVFSAFPLVPLSIVSVPGMEITDVPPMNATRIAVGTVLFFLGLLAYKKK